MSRLGLGVLVGAAIGLADGTHADRCVAAWEGAGDRAQGYLSDRAATPYLAMMLATRHEPPADYRISGTDFVAACRANAIWPATPAATN